MKNWATINLIKKLFDNNLVKIFLKSSFYHCMFLSCHVRVSEELLKCQGTLCSKQVQYLIFRWHSGKYRVWIHSDSYSQIYRTTNYSQFSSIIWSVWRNSWVFIYELNGCGFEFCCSHLVFITLQKIAARYFVTLLRTNSSTPPLPSGQLVVNWDKTLRRPYW